MKIRNHDAVKARNTRMMAAESGRMAHGQGQRHVPLDASAARRARNQNIIAGVILICAVLVTYWLLFHVLD